MADGITPTLQDVPEGSPEHRRRIMLVTRSRIAYRSLFGKPGVRSLGAWVFYVALERPFEITIDGGVPSAERLALVPPYTPHRVSTPDREIAQVLIEAETIDSEALDDFVSTPERRAATRARLLDAFEQPLPPPDDFDRHFFGGSLSPRRLDPRIGRALARIDASCSAGVTAEDCATEAGLSFSRFTHLFSRQTGTTFRRLRAWKRARGLMSMIGAGLSLVDIALDAGYADSTHFSHSIRQFYGYTPRDIFAGSRRLAIVSHWPSGTPA